MLRIIDLTTRSPFPAFAPDFGVRVLNNKPPTTEAHLFLFLLPTSHNLPNTAIANVPSRLVAMMVNANSRYLHRAVMAYTGKCASKATIPKSHSAFNQARCFSIGPACFSPQSLYLTTLGSPETNKRSAINYKSFSTAVAPGVSAKEVLLSSDSIRRIKTELIEADINNDGRLDANELRIILKKHSGAFTDEQVVKLSELFYFGKGGGSVSHETFLQGIAHVTAAAKNVEEDETGLVHRRALSEKVHPLGLGKCGTEFMYGKTPVYTQEELDVKLTHVPPKTISDQMAFAAVKVVRFAFDTVSLWKFGEITQAKVFRRVIFLETVAAIPGFVAAMVRHFKSLRNFSRDGGMLQMFLDEANNERMHLLTFVGMKNPGYIARASVLVSQTVVGVAFFVFYHISPALCHRFVGYVEEEACHTYTDIINAIENAPESSDMSEWRDQLAPGIARGYWHLGEKGTVLELMYAIRADEAEHRDVNHVCSGLKEGQMNPLFNPQDEFDKMLLTYAKDMMKKN